MVATGVGGESRPGSEEEETEEEEERGAVEVEIAVVAVVAVAVPVSTATTLPLLLPSHIGDPDCPCVDAQPCAPMLAQAPPGEAEHSSMPANAASVPFMSKNGSRGEADGGCSAGEQLLVHIEWFGLSPVG